MGRHTGARQVLPELVGVGVVVGGLLFAAGLSLSALAAATPPPPAVTRTVVEKTPGPTVTISYLLEKTATVTVGAAP